jgi:hypothetical protein
MKIETQEQARAIVEEYYANLGKSLPKISDIQVIHSDSAITTIRFHAYPETVQITQTIKIVGSCAPTLVQ